MSEPRLFREENDLQAMQDVLTAGRKAANGTYYIHTGDLRWWLYYPPLVGDFWKDIYLWDDPQRPGRLLGWALLSADWVGFDVYIQPELKGSPLGMDMYTWAEQRALRIAQDKGKPTIYCLWIRHDDEVLCKHFVARGFNLRPGMVHVSRKLDDVLDPPDIPAGFEVRSCRGEPEVTTRASAQYRAFASRAPFEHYEKRFRNFVRSPMYDGEHDVVAVAQDGQIGAFCIIWPEAENLVGLFEPMGTHPEFQRKGLGKAVMLEGLRRLQAYGMRQAIVSTDEDNLAAIRFYESMGFQEIYRLGTYAKDV